MKLTDLLETRATGPFDQIGLSDAIRQHYQILEKHGKQIGSAGYKLSIIQAKMDSNTYIVGIRMNNLTGAFAKFDIVSLFDNQYINIILVHSLTNLASHHSELKSLINKNLILNLLEFMKGHYKLPFVDYGGYQSDDAIRAIKILSRNHKVQWLNIKTGEIVDHDPIKDSPRQGKVNEPFRSKTIKTDWRIIVESSGNHDIENYEIHEAYMGMLKRGLEISDEN